VLLRWLPDGSSVVKREECKVFSLRLDLKQEFED